MYSFLFIAFTKVGVGAKDGDALSVSNLSSDVQVQQNQHQQELHQHELPPNEVLNKTNSWYLFYN